MAKFGRQELMLRIPKRVEREFGAYRYRKRSDNECEILLGSSYKCMYCDVARLPFCFTKRMTWRYLYDQGVTLYEGSVGN